MDDTQQLILVIGLAIGIREGFKLNDEVRPDKWTNTLWHLFGWLMRFLLFGVLYRIGATWFTLTLYVIIVWPLYNVFCNLGLLKKWYYLSDSGIDKILTISWTIIKNLPKTIKNLPKTIKNLPTIIKNLFKHN